MAAGAAAAEGCCTVAGWARGAWGRARECALDAAYGGAAARKRCEELRALSSAAQWVV